MMRTKNMDLMSSYMRHKRTTLPGEQRPGLHVRGINIGPRRQIDVDRAVEARRAKKVKVTLPPMPWDVKP